MFMDNGNVLHFSAPKGRYLLYLCAVFHCTSSTIVLTDCCYIHYPIMPFASNYSFPQPVHAAVNSNTYAIYGHGQEKELTELVPGILNQLGPDSLASLRKMAESYSAGRAAAGGKEKEADDDDDDVPDLVESFEVDEKKSGEAAPADTSANKLEEVRRLSILFHSECHVLLTFVYYTARIGGNLKSNCNTLRNSIRYTFPHIAQRTSRSQSLRPYLCSIRNSGNHTTKLFTTTN